MNEWDPQSDGPMDMLAIDHLGDAFKALISNVSLASAADALAAALRELSGGDQSLEFYRRQVNGYLYLSTAGDIDLTDEGSAEPAASRENSSVASPVSTDNSSTASMLATQDTKKPVVVRAHHDIIESVIEVRLDAPRELDAHAVHAVPTEDDGSDYVRADKIVMAVTETDDPAIEQNRSTVDEVYIYLGDAIVALGETVPASVSTPARMLDALNDGEPVEWDWDQNQ